MLFERTGIDLSGSHIPCHYSYAARIGKPKGSKNKKTLEKLKMKVGNVISSNDQNGNKDDMGGQSPHFHEGSPTLSAHCPVDLVPSAYVDEHLAVDATTEGSRLTPLFDFQHFEGLEDFSSVMDFDITDNAPMWNVGDFD